MDAIATANVNTAAQYTINLAAGTYVPGTDLNLTARSVTLQGPPEVTPSAIIDGACLNISGRSAVVISRLKFTNAPTHAIAITGTEAGTIANCAFSRTAAAPGALIVGTACGG